MLSSSTSVQAVRDKEWEVMRWNAWREKEEEEARSRHDTEETRNKMTP